jgi:hypothetical protein
MGDSRRNEALSQNDKPSDPLPPVNTQKEIDKVPLLERKREILAGQAKERQIRKPADSVPENLPEQAKETRDAVAAEIGT